MLNYLKLLTLLSVLPIAASAKPYCWADSDCHKNHYCTFGASATGAGFCEKNIGYCDDRGARNVWVYISGAWRCMDTKTAEFESHELCHCPMPSRSQNINGRSNK